MVVNLPPFIVSYNKIIHSVTIVVNVAKNATISHQYVCAVFCVLVANAIPHTITAEIGIIYVIL